MRFYGDVDLHFIMITGTSKHIIFLIKNIKALYVLSRTTILNCSIYKIDCCCVLL